MSHLPYVGNSWPGWDPGFKGGVNVDSDEGPAACSPYPGGISAASPGSRSAPRVHLEKETTPEGLKNPQPSHPCRGTESKGTPFSPGACFARPGAIGSHPSGMPSQRRRGSGSGIDWVKAVTQGDVDVATPALGLGLGTSHFRFRCRLRSRYRRGRQGQTPGLLVIPH